MQLKAEIGIWPKKRQMLYEILPLDTPLSMDFMISNICNFRCNYCIQSGTKEDFERTGYKKQFMDMETFELAVKQVKEFPHQLKMLFLVGQGEPTLHKQLPYMVSKIREEGITEKVVLITNGSMLTPEYGRKLVDAGLQELRISLEGISAEKYKEVCRANIDWEQFYSNMVFFSQNKKDCVFKVKIADTALEDGDEDRFYQMFGDICDAVGVEHIYDCFAHLGMDYTDVPEIVVAKNRWGEEIASNIDVCWLPFGKMDLSADGRFTNCCAALFGFEKNIREASMLDVWNGPAMNKMREDMLRHRISGYDACQRCQVPSGTFHPEDILDGHEEIILNRMREKGMLT